MDRCAIKPQGRAGRRSDRSKRIDKKDKSQSAKCSGERYGGEGAGEDPNGIFLHLNECAYVLS